MLTWALPAVLVIIGVFLVFGFTSLTSKRKKARLCWLQLNEQLNRFFSLLTPFVKFLKQNEFRDAEMMARFVKARDLSKNRGGYDPRHRQTAYNNMIKGLVRFEAVFNPRDNLANDETFAALWDSLIKYDEKIHFEASFYNEAVQSYNKLAASQPTMILARLMSYSYMHPFAIHGENNTLE